MRRSSVLSRFLPLFIVACWWTLTLADHTPDPTSVTIPGDFQDELGCPGDWQPDCAVTHLAFDGEDGVWQGTFNIPVGDWGYKAALNDSWTENYGSGAVQDGPTINLSIATATDVKFYYDHTTHWITDDVNSVIAVALGSFQSELGCSGDWDPSCLRSWLQDPDGDGVFSFRATDLPSGDYETKVAIGESWDENYGAGGVPSGPNIPFTVPGDCVEMLFAFDYATKALTVSAAPPAPQPSFVTVAGSLQDELGCPGDWQPDCGASHLAFYVEDGVWQGTFTVPAGNWEYKATLNDSWDVNYGADAQLNGPNIELTLAADTDVKFYYDHETHWITDNVNSVIATVAGSFQSEIGCPDDWQPWCLRSWLQDPDGDGSYTARAVLPAGNYECKVAHDESWDESYGQGGVPGGGNIPFEVPADCTEVVFEYDPVTHLLTIGTGSSANSPPVAVCQDVSAAAGADCMATVMPEDVDGGSFDLDGDPLTLALVPPGPYPVGTTPVKLFVTDDSGALDSCMATVTVTDNAGPTVSCFVEPVMKPFDLGAHAGSKKWGGIPKAGPRYIKDTYRILYEASDCGAVVVSAVIDIGCDQVPVENGQEVKIKCVRHGNPNAPGNCQWHPPGDDPLWIKSAQAALIVTATDAAGNVSTCSLDLCEGSALSSSRDIGAPEVGIRTTARDEVGFVALSRSGDSENWVQYRLAGPGRVQLRVYDVAGRLVRQLVDEVESAGLHTIEWNGGELPAGIYFYVLATETSRETRKLVLLP